MRSHGITMKIMNSLAFHMEMMVSMSILETSLHKIMKVTSTMMKICMEMGLIPNSQRHQRSILMIYMETFLRKWRMSKSHLWIFQILVRSECEKRTKDNDCLF